MNEKWFKDGDGCGFVKTQIGIVRWGGPQMVQDYGREISKKLNAS